MAANQSDYSVKGLINFTNYSTAGSTFSYDLGMGLGLGITKYFALNDTQSISVGLEFLSKNSKEKVSGVTNININTSFLSIPILYNHKISDNLKVYGGGYFALKMAAKSTSFGAEVDIRNYAGSDYGLTLGGSYKINNQMAINIDYSLGLANICTTPGVDIKMNGFTAALEYKL